MNQPDGNIHTVPTDDYQEHQESKNCWCQPTMTYREPSTGVECWTHNRAKDKAQ